MNSTELESLLRSTQKELFDQKAALDQAAIVAITDPQGAIFYVNQKFCDISQYKEEELIGQNHRIINSGYHDREFFKEMWRTISSGRVWTGDVCNRSKDGSLYWVATTIVPFLNHEGKPYQYVAIRFDITLKKKTEEELEEEKNRLVQSEKMASLGVLAAGIAHEIGNPLGALRGRVEMLEMALAKGDIDPVSLREKTQKLMPLIDRMTKIIRGFKAYARDGRQDPKEQFDLVELVNDIIEISREKCRLKGIAIELVGLDQPTFVVGRETEIGQVFVNIFNNACDVAADHEKPLVKITLTEDPGRYSLRVIDSGKGIPDAILSKIWDPFYTTKEVGKGTGLGLSISRRILEDHGGELKYIKDAPNTTFEILLPKV